MPDFVVLERDDEELDAAARDAAVALRVDELRRVARALGRNPTIVEAHAFAAQWSEHCSYKSSRHHLKRLPTKGPQVIIGPGEDAGVVRLGEHDGKQYAIVVAHESHNHPSQVVPFEGAATGVGGIVRDVLCMGAEVVAVADALRFGSVEDANSHQRYVATSVVDGIAAYGNAIGVPNIAGDAYFDEGFNENCLVNVIALGIVKENQIIHSKAPANSDGWDIVLVGKATDASGFGGAAFASLTLDAADAEANKGAVQVPDPFLKNVIMRATYRVFEYLRERKITAGFKDLGAGGIMGCTAELCAAGGFGAIIDLDDVSTAQANLPPAVIAVGETQERLTWVLPPEATADVVRIYNEEFSLPEIARGACAVVIGAVQKEKRYVLRSGSEIVMDVDIDFLTGDIKDELPFDGSALMHTEHARESFVSPRACRGAAEVESFDLNNCSTEPLYKQYDAVVRGATVLPRNNDAGVMIVPGTPLAFAVAVGGKPEKSAGLAFQSAYNAVAEAVCKVVAVGAEPLALTDCLNFGNPRKADHYKQFVAAIDALKEAAENFNLPFVSGNVSFYNESAQGNPIPASAIVACVGGLSDVSKVVSPAFKQASSTLYAATVDAIPALREAASSGTLRSCAVLLDSDLTTAVIKLSEGAKRAGLQLGARIEGDVQDNAAFLIEANADFNGPAVRAIGRTIDRASLVISGREYALEPLLHQWTTPLREVYG
ncbi:MAG: phosphoribosylformylglycinamidine synthase subunit PurL [Candidatus Eremiobacteraeota bacterium]|nr:phosphoribosylformylglycinamidine synthase subunit PurL [Candidatus Eremiobacteraeota bacterium]